ncbi:protein jag [Patescibacteria group bacterium]
MEKKIKKLASDLLSKLDIKPDSIEIKKDDEDTYVLNLKVSEADTGILIGYHGDTIAALQLLLGLMLYHQKNEWVRVVVNVGDYRERRQENLENMAQDTVDKVLQSGQPIALFNLNPFERRTIHMYLSKSKEVVTQSEGEGKNRHLVISPAANDQPSEDIPAAESDEPANEK